MQTNYREMGRYTQAVVNSRSGRSSLLDQFDKHASTSLSLKMTSVWIKIWTIFEGTNWTALDKIRERKYFPTVCSLYGIRVWIGRSVALLRRLHIWPDGSLPGGPHIVIVFNIFNHLISTVVLSINEDEKVWNISIHHHQSQYRHHLWCDQNAGCQKKLGEVCMGGGVDTHLVQIPDSPLSTSLLINSFVMASDKTHW